MLLETALSLTYRHIHLVCYDTSVDVAKFMFDHESTVKTELEDRDCVLYECGNLKFEAFRQRKIGSFDDEMKIWRDNGLYYIGSPLGSDDEDNDEFGGGCGGGVCGGVAGGDEDDDEDDFDDFINNEETEMLNELDTE
jgi:hypothetical protein